MMNEHIPATVQQTQFNAANIRKFKRMAGVVALLTVVFIARGDGGDATSETVVKLPASAAKSVDFEAASRDATEATNAAAAEAAKLVRTLDDARAAAVHLRGVAAVAAHKKRVADRAATAAHGSSSPQKPGVANAFERKVKLGDGSEASFSVFGRADSEDVSVFVLPVDSRRKKFTLVEEFHPGPNRRTHGLIAGMYEPKHGGSARRAAEWELSEEGRLRLGKRSELVELAPGAAGGLAQEKYSTATFVPFLALGCVPDDRPRSRDREEEGSMAVRRVAPDELRRMIAEGGLNVRRRRSRRWGSRCSK